MKLFLGADHRGFELKEHIKNLLHQDGIAFEDLGNTQLDPQDDFPVYAAKVAQTVAQTPNALGIVICGSGVGVDIVANKVPGIRSGFALSTEQVASARRDDNINVLAIAADQTDKGKVPDIIRAFLHTAYESNERRERRLHEIEQLDHE